MVEPVGVPPQLLPELFVLSKQNTHESLPWFSRVKTKGKRAEEEFFKQLHELYGRR
jgi:hypothetical protein